MQTIFRLFVFANEANVSSLTLLTAPPHHPHTNSLTLLLPYKYHSLSVPQRAPSNRHWLLLGLIEGPSGLLVVLVNGDAPSPPLPVDAATIILVLSLHLTPPNLWADSMALIPSTSWPPLRGCTAVAAPLWAHADSCYSYISAPKKIINQTYY